MNPVLRENLEVLIGDGRILTVYFYLLIFFSPVAFGALYTMSLGEQMWKGSAGLLKVCACAAVVLIVYFACRLANQEYAPSRFKPLDDWLRGGRRGVTLVARGRLAALVVHVACMLLLCAPILVWAAAISHTPLAGLLSTLALIPFYGLCYGVWGLVASALWERESQTREFALRLFIVIVVVAALAVYLPLDPVAYLLAILGREVVAPLAIGGVTWSADTAHIAFHLVLGGSGLIAHRRALERALARGHR